MTTFDPADHTVTETLDYADAHPDEVEAILEAEQEGPNRSTAIAGLEQRISGVNAGEKVVPGKPEANTQSPVSKSGEITSQEAQDEFDLTDGSDEYRLKLHEEGKI